VLVVIGALLFAFPAKLRGPLGWLALVVGLSVFAIRLRHEPYAFPERGNLLSGVLALGCGLWLVRPWLGARFALPTRAILAATPVVVFFGLYATLAELEEVVVLRASDERAGSEDLRLWIVDHEGAAWVTMPRWKADANGLVDTRALLVRQGETRCMVTKRHEDFATADAIHRLRHEKYAIQRLATAIGIFGRSAGSDTVAFRLEPCP
jgi:hypothetical protein